MSPCLISFSNYVHIGFTSCSPANFNSATTTLHPVTSNNLFDWNLTLWASHIFPRSNQLLVEIKK